MMNVVLFIYFFFRMWMIIIELIRVVRTLLGSKAIDCTDVEQFLFGLNR